MSYHKISNNFEVQMCDFDVSKKFVLYFGFSSKIHYHSRILCNTLTKNFNVLVITPNGWNVKIDKVFYVSVKNFNNLVNDLCDDVTCIYTDSSIFFFHYKKHQFSNSKITQIFHYPDMVPQCFMEKNFSWMMDKLCCYCMEDYETFRHIFSPSLRPQISNYLLTNILKNNETTTQPKIVSYDRHHAIVKKFYQSYKEQKYKLILFSGRNYLPRDTEHFIQQIQTAEIFFTAEIEAYTHFHIQLAIACGCKCVIPSYYTSLKNQPNITQFTNITEFTKK